MLSRSDFNQAQRPPPVPAAALALLLVVVAAMASLPASQAFIVAPQGFSIERRHSAAGGAGTAAAALGPWRSACCPPRPSLHVAAAAAAAAGDEPFPPTGLDSRINESDEDDEVDADMEAALERTMHTVGIDWGSSEAAAAGGGGPEGLVDTKQDAAAAAAAPSPSAASSHGVFAAYDAGIEPPSSHTVYYGGVHPRSFWRQGREVVQVVVPVAADTPKAAVRFRMESKTRLFLAVEDDVIFDRELAQPVFRDSSYWYFEKLPAGGTGGELKAIVLELDKRLAYSNWPRFFPEDTDLSAAQRRLQEAQMQQVQQAAAAEE